MSCNAEEASCMEVVGSGTLVLALLGSIPGTEQDSFERRERHERISPTRYRQFQLPIVIYEAVQLLTVCGAFCYSVQEFVLWARSMLSIWIPIVYPSPQFNFSGRSKPCHYSRL